MTEELETETLGRFLTELWMELVMTDEWLD